MDIKQNKNIINSLCWICALAFSIHVFLLLIFAYLHITLMVYENILSVVTYVLCFLFVRKGNISTAIYVAFVEILIHAVLAVLCVGLSFGFQLYFIDCIAIMFLADYLSLHMGLKSIGSLKLGFICSILYITFLITTRYYDPIYHINADIAFIGMIVNSVLTLSLVVLFFNMLKNTASLYEEELEKQAIYDNLTGLVNRHYLTEYMEGIYSSGKIDKYWIAILDIDDFKKINDEYGHLCGDFVLKSVAEILKESCADCTICRWGGEEFMIVGVTSTNNMKSEVDLLEDIRKNIEIQDFIYNDTTIINLTVTIGKANYQNNQALSEWFNVADIRLYEGKQSGKNRVVNI